MNDLAHLYDCEHPRPVDFRDGDVVGQFCPLCGLHRRADDSRPDGHGNWDAPAEPLLEDDDGELASLTRGLLELALDLDAWSGGDEDHNGDDGSRMLDNVRRKLGLPVYFGDWILAQHERADRLGVVARFLREHADVDSLRRGGGMFPDVSHVRKFLLAHGRVSWVELLAAAEDEYRMRHSRKLACLVEEYQGDLDQIEADLDGGGT